MIEGHITIIFIDFMFLLFTIIEMLVQCVQKSEEYDDEANHFDVGIKF